jgi:cysteine synthase
VFTALCTNASSLEFRQRLASATLDLRIMILVIPDKMSQEKILHLRALGAKAVITRSDVTKGHPEYYQDLAAKIAAETPSAFYINQFENPAGRFSIEWLHS